MRSTCLRRARASTGLLLTLLALVTMTTAILAGAVGYSSAAATTAARSALTDAPPDATPLVPGVPDPSPNDLVIHQQDLQAVVNALWVGGAEGIQVMDQRLVSTSAVRCVGNTLVLQGRLYSPPYTVTAVGDPEALHAALVRVREIGADGGAGGVARLGRLREADARAHEQ